MSMELQTKIEIRRLCNISHASRLMMLGSCFTEKISERLDYFEFQTLVNPSGITYNPISIAATLQRLIEKKGYCKEDIGCRDGLYYSPDHHGCFSSANVEETIAKVGKNFETAATFLEKTTHIVITLGSSVVYERNGKIWNNCHKLPAKESKTLLDKIKSLFK